MSKKKETELTNKCMIQITIPPCDTGEEFTSLIEDLSIGIMSAVAKMNKKKDGFSLEFELVKTLDEAIKVSF